ncbi:RyR domain-containing protein [Rhodococcoides kyotonense]|uniref:RyR domain-containing protein n=1 Tax=Rhodococcoides kyotonense TaxID=398843 RepID=A0A239FMM3_9NOCA|nr:RyR domain-containing protein [Rhodococcus kyotonensis]SNS58087.1 RyR domain-containing protein [Rhodococcus kyotonensis]
MSFTPEQIAQVTHEANRVLQGIEGDPAQSPHWDDAPQWQKDSAIDGVEGALNGRTPEESHQGWLDHKAKDGWVYGEVKDPEKKTHPCCVPYDQLPENQQIKDHLFTSIVRTLAELD